MGTIGLSPSFPLWVNCSRNTSVIFCVNTLTFLTNSGDSRLASLPPMPSYQPLMNSISTLRMRQKCRVCFLTSRRHSIVSPIVFWLTNSTNWRSLATWSDGSPVTFTTESSKLVSWVNFHLQLQLSQVYHRVLFWDCCCFWLYWWLVGDPVIWW